MTKPPLRTLFAPLVLGLTVLAACGGNKPPVANMPAPPPTTPFPGAVAPAESRSTRPPDPPPIPSEVAVASSPLGDLANQPIDTINGPDSPLKPAFFDYDSDVLDDAAKAALNANAQVLKTYPSWVISVEGHCDERGSAEYNLALGDRRANAARNYLISLGISADRLRTVSYGKEFPFDAGHDEGAYHLNRRAHFLLTAK